MNLPHASRLIHDRPAAYAQVMAKQPPDKRPAENAICEHWCNYWPCRWGCGMIDKPQICARNNGMRGAEQLQTCRNRQTATEITRGRQQHVTKAETRLAVSQADMQAIDKAVADLNRRAAKRGVIAP
jgi:hypothetical protein